MNALIAAALLQVTIVTDPSWKGSEAPVEGWEKPETFLEWEEATSGKGPASHGPRYGVENMFGFPSKAEWIYRGDGNRCALRRVIDVPNGFRRAEMVMVADDEATVYINGEPVSKWDTKLAAWGMRGGAGLVDLTPYLVDGMNVIGVELINRIAAWGFAAEIRIDGEPFVLPVRGKGEKLSKETLKKIDSLAGRLDDDSPAARGEAAAELVRLAEKHGSAMLDRMTEIAKNGSEEAKTAAKAVIDKILPDLDPPPGMAETFAFGKLDIAGLKALFTAAAGRQVVLIRGLASAKVLAAKEEKGVVDAVQTTLSSGGDEVWDRVIPYISILEMKALTSQLVDAVKKRPKTVAGACAASALGRMGDKSHVKVLEEAAKCGHPPTERAAKRALTLLKK